MHYFSFLRKGPLSDLVWRERMRWKERQRDTERQRQIQRDREADRQRQWQRELILCFRKFLLLTFCLLTNYVLLFLLSNTNFEKLALMSLKQREYYLYTLKLRIHFPFWEVKQKEAWLIGSWMVKSLNHCARFFVPTPCEVASFLASHSESALFLEVSGISCGKV